MLVCYAVILGFRSQFYGMSKEMCTRTVQDILCSLLSDVRLRWSEHHTVRKRICLVCAAHGQPKQMHEKVAAPLVTVTTHTW
jgi:hypothetical protein